MRLFSITISKNCHLLHFISLLMFLSSYVSTCMSILLALFYLPSIIGLRQKTRDFLKELSAIIPNSEVRLRNHSSIKKTAAKASQLGYTDLMFVNEDKSRKVVANGLLHVHLPDGPTALYRLSNLKLSAQFKVVGSSFLVAFIYFISILMLLWQRNLI